MTVYAQTVIHVSNWTIKQENNSEFEFPFEFTSVNWI